MKPGDLVTHRFKPGRLGIVIDVWHSAVGNGQTGDLRTKVLFAHSCEQWNYWARDLEVISETR